MACQALSGARWGIRVVNRARRQGVVAGHGAGGFEAHNEGAGSARGLVCQGEALQPLVECWLAAVEGAGLVLRSQPFYLREAASVR